MGVTRPKCWAWLGLHRALRAWESPSSLRDHCGTTEGAGLQPWHSLQLNNAHSRLFSWAKQWGEEGAPIHEGTMCLALCWAFYGHCLIYSAQPSKRDSLLTLSTGEGSRLRTGTPDLAGSLISVSWHCMTKHCHQAGRRPSLEQRAEHGAACLCVTNNGTKVKEVLCRRGN